VRVVALPGTHDSLLQPPLVDEVARVLGALRVS
jgi:hypothetical protein